MVNNFNKGVLCSYPYKDFGQMHRGERVLITGENNSGKSLVVFDMVASLIESDNNILFISDVYGATTVKRKLAYALHRIRNGRKSKLDPSASDLASIIENTFNHPCLYTDNSNILFNSVQLESKFDEYDFDAVFVDEDILTYQHGKESMDLLMKLSELSIKYNVLTSYVLHESHNIVFDSIIDTKVVTSKEGTSLTATKLNGLTEVSGDIFKVC